MAGFAGGHLASLIAVRYATGELMIRTLCWLLLSLLLGQAAANAQDYALRTEFTGKGKCLDVVNDGHNRQLIMAACANVSGQRWRIDEASKPGFTQLRNGFTGRDMCLDIVNDGQNNKLIMARCANVSGQFWRIESPDKSTKMRLRTLFTGNGKCLDIVNDGANNRLTMASCGNYSGQLWHLDDLP